MRSGTLNVPGIVGLGMACEICKLEMEEEARRSKQLLSRLWEGISGKIDGVSINGNVAGGGGHILNLRFEGVDGEMLMMAMKDVAISSGSACTSASVAPSYVLKAMGLSEKEAGESVRFSVGRMTTDDEVEYVIERVAEVVEKIRGMG